MTVPFLTALLLGELLSDMGRVANCHAGVLGSNPGAPKKFPLELLQMNIFIKVKFFQN